MLKTYTIHSLHGLTKLTSYVSRNEYKCSLNNLNVSFRIHLFNLIRNGNRGVSSYGIFDFTNIHVSICVLCFDGII